MQTKRHTEKDSTTRRRNRELEEPTIDRVPTYPELGRAPAPPGRVGYTGSPIGPEHPRTTPRGSGTEDDYIPRR